MKLDYLEKMIEIAGSDLGFDLKKNIGSKPLSGSKKTKEE